MQTLPRQRSAAFSRHRSPVLSWICLAALCAGCAVLDKAPLQRRDNEIVLLNPAAGLGKAWEHHRLRRGDTTYESIESSLGRTIRASGNNSASIMIRLFEPIGLECGTLRWSWLVQQPQPGSDLRRKGHDDVAASVFVLFGDPGIMRDKPVPTLKYAWTNDNHQKDDIIAGPYYSEYIRTIIVRTGKPAKQALITESADLIDDYTGAFGEAPKNNIYGIAIYSDNDDTREPIVAHYGRIELRCNSDR